MNYWLRIRKNRKLKFYFEIPGVLDSTEVTISRDQWHSKAYRFSSTDATFYEWVRDNVSTGALGMHGLLEIEVDGDLKTTQPLVNLYVVGYHYSPAYTGKPSQCDLSLTWTHMSQAWMGRYLP